MILARCVISGVCRILLMISRGGFVFYSHRQFTKLVTINTSRIGSRYAKRTAEAPEKDRMVRIPPTADKEVFRDGVIDIRTSFLVAWLISDLDRL